MKKSVKVMLQAGLGNQMHIFAGYLWLRKQYPELKVKLAFQDYLIGEGHYGIELTKVFKLPLGMRFRIGCVEFARRYFPKFVSKKLYSFFCRLTCIGNPHHPHFEVMNSRDILKNEIAAAEGSLVLRGYFSDCRFHEAVSDELHSICKSQDAATLSSEENGELCRRIEESPVAVSVHVRRGDYLDSENSDFKNVGDTDFYERAYALFSDRKDATFVVFSDDIEWCRERLKFITHPVTFVDWNTGRNSYKDMLLMARCHHNIIANSTFSWWGAMLNPHPDKQVIAPVRWFNSDFSQPHLLPTSWRKI